MLRVLHLRSSAGFFGAERVIMTLLGRAQQSQLEAHLACIENYVTGDQSLVDLAKKEDHTVTQLPCSSRIDKLTINALITYCEQNKIDLIHSHDYKSHFYAFFAGRKTRIPYVATLHGRTFGDLKNRVFEVLENLLLKPARKIVVVSDVLDDAMRKAGMGKKTIQIPNGVNELTFHPDNPGKGKSHWGFSDEHFVFGTVARFSQEKGHPILLDAFAEVHSKYPQARLLLIGDGPLFSEMHSKAESLNISQHIHFAGAQTDVENILQDIDCYLSPSLTEGMPMSILEAMASNLPIIATEVGSLGEVLDEGCGILIPPGEVAALAEAMSDIIERQGEAKEMANRARTRIESHYSAAQQSDRYAEIYHSVVDAT